MESDFPGSGRALSSLYPTFQEWVWLKRSRLSATKMTKEKRIFIGSSVERYLLEGPTFVSGFLCQGDIPARITAL